MYGKEDNLIQIFMLCIFVNAIDRLATYIRLVWNLIKPLLCFTFIISLKLILA